MEHIKRWATAAHVGLYRQLGGRLVGTVAGRTTLLLTTTGRRTGQRRTHPLLYRTDGDAYVVVASNFGSDQVPRWWLNLRHDPRAELQVGRRRLVVVAEQACAEDEQHLWPLFIAMYPRYADYRRRTTRHIPVVVLRPVGATA